MSNTNRDSDSVNDERDPRSDAAPEPPPVGDGDEEYALYATTAVDRDAATALFALLHEIDLTASVSIDSVVCTSTGDVELVYQRADGPPVGDEAAHLTGAYIQGYREADDSLAGLEATVTAPDGSARARWRLDAAWIEEYCAGRYSDDDLMESVSSTVEVM